MATYLILNTLFVLVVVVVFRLRPVPGRAWLLSGLILLLLTALFDSLIVGFDIVAYDQSKLLGLYIGKAPIEDFFYTLLALLLVPTLWHTLDKDARND